MRNGKEKTAMAARIGNTIPPSKLYEIYNPDLQGVLDGRCVSISYLTERADVPTLRDISDAYNDDDVSVEWIKIQLEKVNSFMNVKDKLNIEQLYDVGVQILNCYGNLNVLEFSLFCGRMRHGKYERFFGSVDPMKILMSIDMFMKERSNDLYRRYEEEKKKEMDNGDGEESVVDVHKLMKENPGKYPFLERIFKR